MQREPEQERMDTAEAADAYARADFEEVNRKFADDAKAFLGAAKRLLDLGCGPGDIPILLAESVQYERLVAVDAAATMLRWAKQRVAASPATSRISLLQADAKRLPFPDKTFDAVVSNSILHHVADPAAFWQESARVTAKGGRLFMRDLVRPASIGDVERLVEAYARDESEMLRGEFYRSLCAAYTIDEVRAQLADAGLNLLAVRESSDRHMDIHGVIQ